MTIISRINQIANKEGITLTKLERTIGASKGVLSRASKNDTDIQSKWVSRVVENYPLYNTNWLLTGKGEMLLSGEKETANDLTSNEASLGAVPFWNLQVSAGHSVTDIIGQSKPDGYIKGLPGADIAENILPVSGASMEPEVSNGAIIGVRHINNWESLNTERIYMIITKDDRMIKRIEYDNENEDILWCVSPNYPKFKIFKADIVEIQRVCFVYNPK